MKYTIAEDETKEVAISTALAVMNNDDVTWTARDVVNSAMIIEQYLTDYGRNFDGLDEVVTMEVR